MAAPRALQSAGVEGLPRLVAWRATNAAPFTQKHAPGTSQCKLGEAVAEDQCWTGCQDRASSSKHEVLHTFKPSKPSLPAACMHFLRLLCPSEPNTLSTSTLPSNLERATIDVNLENTTLYSNARPCTQSKAHFQDAQLYNQTRLPATIFKSLPSLRMQSPHASTGTPHFAVFSTSHKLYSHTTRRYSTEAPITPPATTFPSIIDDFTATWLTDVLRSCKAIGADSAVQSFQPEQIGKGVGLVSSLYSIKVTYIGAPGPHAPSRLVGKFAHPSEEARAFAMRNGSYEREARFYQNFGTRPAATPATVNRHKVPIRTPEICFCEYDSDAAKLCILMQDVSDFEPLDQIKGATFEEALGVMQDIGRFHALCWNSPDFDTWRWLPKLHEPRFLASDPQEFRTAWPRALKLFPGLIPEHLLHPISQLPEAAPRLLERLGKAPRTLLHGDLRLDNVYIHRGKADADKAAPLVAGVAQEPNLLFIDFGDCCVGRGGHDVGYFLSQSLDPAVRREHEKKLLHAYWGALHGSDEDDVGTMQERLEGFTFEDLVEDYKLGVLYNFCLAVNMANLIEEGKGGERVRVLAKTALERAVQAIEDHNLGELLLEHLS